MMTALTDSRIVSMRYDISAGDSITTKRSMAQAGTRTTYRVKVKQGMDGFLIATVPELPGVVTQAKDESSLIRNVIEAVGLMIEDSQNNKEFNILLDTKDSE